MRKRFGPRELDRLRALLSEREPRRSEALVRSLAADRDRREATSAGPDGRRPAAVLIPLFLRSDELWVVLTRKTDHLPHHSGQVSFPGGALEASDEGLEAAALREAREEAGIEPEDVDLFGPLDDMPTATTRFVIRPFVGQIPYPYRLVPDGFEVDRVFTAPLDVFADPSRCRIEYWERAGTRHAVHFFDDVDGELVWGATARMLIGLVDLLGDA